MSTLLFRLRWKKGEGSFGQTQMSVFSSFGITVKVC